MSNGKAIELYDVWYAEVAHEDDPSESDDRPVVVIDEKRGIYAALKMTKTKAREEFWGEYTVKRWRETGLSYPTTIRISKFLRLRPEDFRRRIGSLSTVDIAGIQSYIDRIYRNAL